MKNILIQNLENNIFFIQQVISTRKVQTEDGTLFLDMKCGNLMQQRITRIQTDQVQNIYIHIYNYHLFAALLYKPMNCFRCI